MKKKAKETDVYGPEYQILTHAKEILSDPSLKKNELLKEYAKMVKEYEDLLKKFYQQDQVGEHLSPGKILEMQSQLLSRLSYEFRTPLTLIISSLEQMCSQCRSALQKKKMALMLRNARRLLFLINQVLALSSTENSQLKIKVLPEDIVSFVKGITASFDLLVEQNEVDLIFKADKDNMVLYFDPELMAEVICNLMMNALKYTPAGGQIRIWIGRSYPDSVVISVQDTGPGIPRDRLKSIFYRFSLLNRPFERHRNDIGIGLFLVKEYITLHHGTIHINSSEGQGTEFVIKLPMGNEHLAPDQIEETPVPSSPIIRGSEIAANYTLMWELEKEEVQFSNIKATDIETHHQERDIVLVVEDDRDMRNLVITLLGRTFTVVEAKNGREGIDIAQKIIPDIIISDIIMPKLDGIRLCRDLKNNINTSHIPIILLTARASEEDVIRGLEAGADDYITKPFNIKMLLTRVKNLICLRRRLQEKLERRMLMQPEEFSLSQLENLFLDKIQESIEQNLSNPDFGVDELAEILEISRPTLYRKLFALTGQSPKKFIQSYRLKRSMELLRANYGNVTEVAFKVGFSSSAYFTKCFRETFQRLPSDFTTY
jgi:signal transduction histidine kinase/DNA-binding response OmpR family regulator